MTERWFLWWDEARRRHGYSRCTGLLLQRNVLISDCRVRWTLVFFSLLDIQNWVTSLDYLWPMVCCCVVRDRSENLIWYLICGRNIGRTENVRVFVFPLFTRFPLLVTKMLELFVIAITRTIYHNTDDFKAVFIIIKGCRKYTKLGKKPIIIIITIHIIDADIINHISFIIIKCFVFVFSTVICFFVSTIQLNYIIFASET